MERALLYKPPGLSGHVAKAAFIRQDGVITVVVLWVCAIVMWFGFQISVETRLKGEEQIHQFRRTQALYLAIGGCYEALGRMGQATSLGLDRKDGKWHTGKVRHKGERIDPDEWLPDGYPRIIDFQTGQALVVIEPEDKKVNVNKVTQPQLRQVFQKAGLNEADAENLSDIILDFLDKDDHVRLHGAEKDQYKSLGLPYGPFNGPLTSIDQLLLIPGITQQLFYGFGMNPGDGEEEKESDIPSVPELPKKYSLFSLLTVYGSNTTFKEEKSGLFDDGLSEEPVDWRPGKIYRILSCGRAFSGSPTVLMWLTIRLSPQSEDGYEVLYRRTL